MDYPKLRPVEVIPVREDLVGLRDPYHYADNILLVPPALLEILALFDGGHSILDIQYAYTKRHGQLLMGDRVRQIVAQLDEAFFLDSERYRRRQEQVEREYRENPVRPATHSGSAYAADPEKLRSELDGYFAAALKQEQPGAPLPEGALRGLIAPHIDLKRGGLCFAQAWGRLAEAGAPTTLLILGISHVATRNRFVLTRKDFETPLGIAATERSFIEELASRCSTDFFADEIVHRHEHSIEFQALFLRHLFPEARDLRIVPILCGSFLPEVMSGTSPLEDPQVAEMVGALRGLLAERKEGFFLAAGVDLSHVGPRFGDSEPLTDEFMRSVREQDARMLERILAGDAEGFIRFIQTEKDRRVCGVPAIYTLLRLLEPTLGRLGGYQAAVDSEGGAAVSFAAAAFYGQVP